MVPQAKADTVANSLRITELMYHPGHSSTLDDPNLLEYVELQNTGSSPINLSLVSFIEGIDFTFGNIDLLPNEYCLIVRDEVAFENNYGNNHFLAGQYVGSLNDGGEKVEFVDAAGNTIQSFSYNDRWYPNTEGQGASLIVNDPTSTRTGHLSKRSDWRPSALVGGSPSTEDAPAEHAPGTVVINELLAHSHDVAADWIELYNTSDQAISIGGWYLSDEPKKLMKYEIAAGTIIGPNSFFILHQEAHFGNANDPGSQSAFALSENGEIIYLHSGSNGVLGTYSEQEEFGASETGVSFGRHLKSTNTYNFVAMSINSPGWENEYPKVGPVVISEVMYHPANLKDAEYIELHNVTDEPITLVNANSTLGWRFYDEGGLDFSFPTDLPVTLAADERLLLVNNMAIAQWEYSIANGVQVFQWDAGKLSNDSERLQLDRPGELDGKGKQKWIRIDRITYSDGSNHQDYLSGTDPWPTKADGEGFSLSRINALDYGNDPANWDASVPSPGN